MLECVITAAWCFTINFTILDSKGVQTKQEWYEFNSEAACRDLEDYYKPLIGKLTYGKYLPDKQRSGQFSVNVHWAECFQLGKLR